MLARTFPAFGTLVTLHLWPRPGGRAQAAVALRRAVAFLRHAERRLSRFDPESELSRLNRAGGRPVRLSPISFAVIDAALEAAAATGGLFDPTVLPALVAAGYDRSLTGRLAPLGAAPVALSGRPAASVWRGPAFRTVAIDRQRRTVTLPEGVALDLGGIAKGWLADAVVRRLERHGAALADLGGDIACTAPPRGQAAWEVEVEDPGGGPPLGVLALRGGGVATSGVTRRRWQTADGLRHHLIDPRTGRSATVDLASVTVAAPSATVAEVAAKVLLLLGGERAEETLALTPALAAVFAPTDGPARFTGARRVRWHPVSTEGARSWPQAI